MSKMIELRMLYIVSLLVVTERMGSAVASSANGGALEIKEEVELKMPLENKLLTKVGKGTKRKTAARKQVPGTKSSNGMLRKPTCLEGKC